MYIDSIRYVGLIFKYRGQFLRIGSIFRDREIKVDIQKLVGQFSSCALSMNTAKHIRPLSKFFDEKNNTNPF